MEQEVGLRQSLIGEVNSVRNLALIVTFTGLVFLSTSIFFIAIPTSNGFFNIGEIFVYLAALIGGPITGAIAGGMGAMLADIALGYGVFAPGTLIIKGIEGFVVGVIFHYSRRLKKWIRYLFMAALCGILIGFSLVYFAFPLMGVAVNIEQATMSSMMFFMASYARAYGIRRVFNWLGVRSRA